MSRSQITLLLLSYFCLACGALEELGILAKEKSAAPTIEEELIEEENPSATTTVLDSADEAVIKSESKGIKTSRVVIDSSKSIKVSGSKDSAISNAAIVFPPGSLSIATDITIQEGSEIINSDVMEELGLDSKMNIGGTGLPVAVFSSEAIDAIEAFTLAAPLPFGVGLALAGRKNLAVIYLVTKQDQGGSNFRGIIPFDQLLILGDLVFFESRYFGVFQVVKFSEAVAKTTETSTSTPVRSRSDIDSLAAAVWTDPNATLIIGKEGRFVEISAEFSEVERVSNCTVLLDRNKAPPWDYAYSSNIETKHIFEILEPESLSVFGLLACTDNYGRPTNSLWSDKIQIPKLITDSSPPSPATDLLTTADSVAGEDVRYDDDTEIFLSWKPALDEESSIVNYGLYLYTQADCEGDFTIIDTLETSYKLEGIGGNTYSFLVTASNGWDFESSSECSGKISLDTIPPPKPSVVYITADRASDPSVNYDNDKEIFFVWDEVTDHLSGVASYTLHRFDQADCSGESTDTETLTTTSESFEGSIGSTYSFQISTTDLVGLKSTSDCSNNMTIDTSPPIAPTSPQIARDSASGGVEIYDDDTTIFFNWTAGSDAQSGISSYTVHSYNSANCGGLPTSFEGITSTYYAFNGQNGSTYSFKVTAVNGSGYQTISTCSGAMYIDTTPPVSASSLKISADSVGGAAATFDNDTSIYFSWANGSDPQTGISSYILHRFDQANCAGDPTNSAPLTGNSQLFVGTHGTTYSIKISTVNNASGTTLSECSNDLVIDTATPGNPATLITAADSANGPNTNYDNDTTIYYAWSESSAHSGVASYTIYQYSQANCGGSASSVAGLTTRNRSYVGSNTNTYSFKIITHSNAGYQSTSDCSGNITIDLDPPTSNSISISSGATYTSSSTISLSLGSSGASQMYITNSSSDCSSGGSYETFSSIKVWTLGQSNSTATVYVKFRDAALNETACISDSIAHDSIAPSDPGSFDDGSRTSDSTSSPTLSWSASSDGLSGISHYEAALGSSSGGTDIKNFTNIGTGTSGSLSGLALPGGTFYASLRSVDNAGNPSSVVYGDGFLYGWTQQAYVKAPEVNAGDHYGTSVGISGNTVVIGAWGEDSSSSSITNGSGASNNNSLLDSGAAYVYLRTGTTWAQEAFLKPNNPDSNDLFGVHVAIDGNTLVVCAPGEDSNQQWISSGGGSDDNLDNSGAAYVYIRSGSTWSLQAFIKAVNSDENDTFCDSVAISGDTIAIAASGEDSNQQTITNGSTASSNNSSDSSGAIYVYTRSGTSWSQQAYIKASDASAGDYCCRSIDIDGDTIVSTNAQKAHVYIRSSGNWSEQSIIQPSNTNYIREVAISGNTIVLGNDNDNADYQSIINGTNVSTDTNGTSSGAAYVYQRTGTTWIQEAYIKASNSDSYDSFGRSVDIDEDQIVIGAVQEQSNQTSISNGTSASSDNSKNAPGAAYVFSRSGSIWSQTAYLKAPNLDDDDNFGWNVAIDGGGIAVGARYEDSNQATITNGNTASSDNSMSSSGAAYIYNQ